MIFIGCTICIHLCYTLVDFDFVVLRKCILKNIDNFVILATFETNFK